MIRMIAMGLVGIASLSLAANASSEDLEFGADSLPYLADSADLVARVSGAERIQARQRSVSAYTVTIGEVIRGDGSAGANVTILVPRGFDVQTPEQLSQGVLFLRRVDDVEISDLEVASPDRPFYWLVSGSYGALGSDTEDPRKAVAAEQVREYVQLRDRDAKLRWAESQIGAGNEYLQRSALFELAQPEYADEPRAVQILGEAARSTTVDELNRGTAIQLLEKSESPQALDVLKEVATDQRASASLRRSAVQAMPGLPGGQEVLRDLAVSGAPELKPVAQEVLGDFTPQGAPSADLEEIQGMLLSPKRVDRERGFRQLDEARPSAETVRVLGAVIVEGTPGGTGDKIRAVEALGEQRSREAIERLAAVAKDTGQPEVVRSQAILEIAKQPTGLRIGVMEDLSQNLEPGQLQDLATGLKQ